jgi:hypothetical protein
MQPMAALAVHLLAEHRRLQLMRTHRLAAAVLVALTKEQQAALTMVAAAEAVQMRLQ